MNGTSICGDFKLEEVALQIGDGAEGGCPLGLADHHSVYADFVPNVVVVGVEEGDVFTRDLAGADPAGGESPAFSRFADTDGVVETLAVCILASQKNHSTEPLDVLVRVAVPVSIDGKGVRGILDHETGGIPVGDGNFISDGFPILIRQPDIPFLDHLVAQVRGFGFLGRCGGHEEGQGTTSSEEAEGGVHHGPKLTELPGKRLQKNQWRVRVRIGNHYAWDLFSPCGTLGIPWPAQVT